ncbi:hypothetical protein ASPZODRAFT_61950 [Penicilliopsis zonata CBS 506.65]|uniref:AAA+ ATPase domain-containing protein n=1 Tax=Penicilliopsis zonata CBS 506.65 TaxID=1073090 RepID=A0A1L9SLX4_9EURO|nr:hypothetical protein ASPZODRAFT_61950 [Penicilliopsis zonata CBS 506.65]OJJ48282.1 hypothetical protein ASPZODRAFT_61950 [Penicilliopsis zonata CBS 506.65]
MDGRIAAFRITSKALALALRSTWDASDEVEQIICYRPFIDPMHFFDKAKTKLAEMEALAEHDLLPPSVGRRDSSGDASHRANDPSLVAQLRGYVEFMEEEIVPFYSHIKTLTAADDFCVEFDDLFHLFQPGDIIVYPEAALHHERVTRSNRGDQKLWRVFSKVWKVDSDEFVVKAYCIDYNGDSYVCTQESFTIWRFEGVASVSSLKVFPIRFASNMQALYDDAKRQGEAFQKFIKSKLVAHNGWASEPNPTDPTLRYITGDVVIDFAETFKAHPDCKPVSELPDVNYTDKKNSTAPDDDAKWSWVNGEKLEESKENFTWYDGSYVEWVERSEYCRDQDPFLSNLLKGEQGRYNLREEDLYLLPHRLFAYSLQDRRFVAVDVDNLKPIEYQGSKFDDLIINQAHERMLRALVESHFSRKETIDLIGSRMTAQDIFENKGRGLVILLHGVPGVGKTSTTETIASEFKKPLLPITCGDLGLDPATVEQSLKEIFRLAQVWDCILLLDEADVFLTERVPSDLSRNALVSAVFLRVLDYYTGVLFLTTNRVGTIDEAFKSRLHVSLYYPHLKRNQTEKIWQINLRRLTQIEEEQSRITGQPSMTVDHDGIMDFAREHYQKGRESGNGVWNGRQIRNAFLIASALARFEKSRSPQQQPAKPYDLNASHFKTVVEAGFGFERYLHEVKGKTDGEAAFLQGTRADYILSSQGKPDQSSGSSPGQGTPRNLPHRPVTPVRNPANAGWNGGYHNPGAAVPSQAYAGGGGVVAAAGGGAYAEAPQHQAASYLSPTHTLLHPQPQFSMEAGTFQDRWGQQQARSLPFGAPHSMATGHPAVQPSLGSRPAGQSGYRHDSDDD